VDNTSLDQLLGDKRERHYWLKPVGPPKDHPDWGVEENRTWTEDQVEIHFAKSPARIAVGAVIIANRVRYSQLIYVSERLPVDQWAEPEIRSAYSRQRWPFHVKACNLTPEFGRSWNAHALHPFMLARAYNVYVPDNPVHLGSIRRGNDKARIPRRFGEFLIRLIREL
jgi:hypothetical protein